MSNQKYFDVPFGFSGDKTAIPDPLQTGGTVSFTEGWNYNYQRNLSTDPAALPIDRSTMNWLFDQITTAIQALQQTGTPEFILSTQNGGVAFPYGPQAAVLWSASGNAPFTRFINISGATNSNTPSLSDPLGATSGWQVSCDPIATAAQAGAGTDNAHIMTPLLVAQQTALRALLAGSATQVFNVGPATAATHAPEVGQVQKNAFNYAGVAGGTANALTAALAPAPTAYTDDLVVVVRVLATNTAGVTLAVNGLAATAAVGAAHSALQGGELVAGGFACFAYSTQLSNFVLLWATGGAEQVGTATASQQAMPMGQALLGNRKTDMFANTTWTCPAGVTAVFISASAGGGGGGGGAGGTPTNGGAGGGGGGAGQWVNRAKYTVTPGAVYTITIGASGASGTGTGGANAGNGGNGGSTSVTGTGLSLTLPGGSGGSGGTYSPTLSGAGFGGVGFPYGQGGGAATPQFPTGYGGMGASCPFGGGGGGGYGGFSSSIPSTQGNTGFGYGAGGGGGGGGYLGASNVGFNGGTGAPGFVTIEW